MTNEHEHDKDDDPMRTAHQHAAAAREAAKAIFDIHHRVIGRDKVVKRAFLAAAIAVAAVNELGEIFDDAQIGLMIGQRANASDRDANVVKQMIHLISGCAPVDLKSEDPQAAGKLASLLRRGRLDSDRRRESDDDRRN